MSTETNQDAFANRINRINKSAAKAARKNPGRRSRSLGSILVTPLMFCLFMAGGTVYAWDVMDRPTDNPFEVAGALTAMVLSQ